MAEAPFSIRRLNPDDERPAFDCGHSDLNEYFHQDSIQGGKELISVTYVVERQGSTLAYFSLSNDAIRKADLPNSRRKKFLALIPRPKQYSSMPAVKIGRLGVAHASQRDGTGTQVLDFLKMWFTVGNKTGCRFIVVDAYNFFKLVLNRQIRNPGNLRACWRSYGQICIPVLASSRESQHSIPLRRHQWAYRIRSRGMFYLATPWQAG